MTERKAGLRSSPASEGSSLMAALEKLRAIVDPDVVVIGESLTEKDAQALLIAIEAADGMLQKAFVALVAHESFNGSHISIDRAPRGEMTMNIAPDWIDGRGLTFLANLARELELSIALTNEGVRLEPQTSEMVRGVQAVKDTLAADEEADDDD